MDREMAWRKFVEGLNEFSGARQLKWAAKSHIVDCLLEYAEGLIETQKEAQRDRKTQEEIEKTRTEIRESDGRH